MATTESGNLEQNGRHSAEEPRAKGEETQGDGVVAALSGEKASHKVAHPRDDISGWQFKTMVFTNGLLTIVSGTSGRNWKPKRRHALMTGHHQATMSAMCPTYSLPCTRLSAG